MNVVKYTLMVGIALISLFGHAQNIEFGLESGFGQNGMSDLQRMNTNKLSSLKFKANQTSNFPNYWYYKPSVGIAKGSYVAGFSCQYLSTGSNISTSDYSGEYYYKVRVHTYAPAAFITFRATYVWHFLIQIGLSAGVDFSKYTSDEKLTVLKQSYKDEIVRLNSRTSFIEPSISGTYPYKSFRLLFNAGYHIMTSDKPIELPITEQNPPSNIYKTKYDLDWTGYRLGIGISYLLK